MQAQVAYTCIIAKAATLHHISVPRAFGLSPAPQACKDSLSMNALFQVYEHASCLVPSAESALTPITKDKK